jgi:hypothetical protein
VIAVISEKIKNLWLKANHRLKDSLKNLYLRKALNGKFPLRKNNRLLSAIYDTTFNAIFFHAYG